MQNRTAINKLEAFDKTNGKVFDAVLMDINIRAELNGLETTKK
jgi:CheY-like chemotaxis protein